MGNYFSSASNEKSGEENTINTDMLGDSEEIYTVERTQNELNKNKLNNKILNILDSETIKEGGNYNSNINIYNINKKIFNILNILQTENCKSSHILLYLEIKISFLLKLYFYTNLLNAPYKKMVI